MTVIDPTLSGPVPARSADDSLAVNVFSFAAVVFGWFPAVFLGDAVAKAADAGSELALLVAVMAYVSMVAAPRVLRRLL